MSDQIEETDESGRDGPRCEQRLVSELPANTGRLEQAKRFAMQNFDKWNDVTGFVAPHTGYYYELSSVIEDAVEFGFGVAHGQRWRDIVKRIRPANVERMGGERQKTSTEETNENET